MQKIHGRIVRIVAAAALAMSLAGCDMISKVINTFKHISAVQDALAQETGMKPTVNVHWQNGRMDVVNVTFPHPYDKKPLRELTADIRAIVTKEFQQAPERIVIGSGEGQGQPTQSKHNDGEQI